MKQVVSLSKRTWYENTTVNCTAFVCYKLIVFWVIIVIANRILLGMYNHTVQPIFSCKICKDLEIYKQVFASVNTIIIPYTRIILGCAQIAYVYDIII